MSPLRIPGREEDVSAMGATLSHASSKCSCTKWTTFSSAKTTLRAISALAPQRSWSSWPKSCRSTMGLVGLIASCKLHVQTRSTCDPQQPVILAISSLAERATPGFGDVSAKLLSSDKDLVSPMTGSWLI